MIFPAYVSCCKMIVNHVLSKIVRSVNIGSVVIGVLPAQLMKYFVSVHLLEYCLDV